MIILGIDPGLQVTGYGIIDLNDKKMIYKSSGRIKTSTNQGNLPKRLKIIIQGLNEIITEYKPQCISIEKVFVNSNPNSTLILGQARGAAISISVINNIDVFEYTALQIKKSVVGYGHAKKFQVQSMIQKILNLPSIASEDSSDALAAAVCHAHSMNFMSKISNMNQIKSSRFV